MKQVLRSAFTKPVDDVIFKYVASIDCDRHLVECDVRGSLAHAAMLEKIGVLTVKQAANIKRGLEQILAEGLMLRLEHEDVHMNVEKRLEEIIGADAKLLHTARSRNDQVALDLRLFVAQEQAHMVEALKKLCTVLTDKAAAHADVVMPGYTHLQRAQVVLFAQVMLAFHEAFARDMARLAPRLISPLGAGALAGSAIPVDPAFTAEKLGAQGFFTNSIDAVSDRDFAAEFIFACSLVAIHLSQLAENLILWCTAEFNFVKLPDEITTGSSIMPQKKNPDCLELVRGKTGQSIGELVNLLTTLKALPFGYNRDLQETKPPVVRVAETVRDSVEVCTIAISKMELNREVMRAASLDEYLFATDIVEYLVAQGMPFRDAHSKVGELVKTGKKFSEIPLETWKQVGINPDVVQLVNPEKSVEFRQSPGGTSPASVLSQLGKSKIEN
ncbi:MAG: argininosuccinate lyase [Blastocatellia bacterium]|nr:argininosuccinate lyase [Blastocatellia bacterium]